MQTRSCAPFCARQGRGASVVAAVAIFALAALSLIVYPAQFVQAADGGQVPRSGLRAEYLFTQTSGTSVPNTADSSVGDASVVNGSDENWTGDSLQFVGGAKTSSANWVQLPDNLLTDAQAATVTAEVKASASMISSFHFLWNIGNESSTTEYMFASLNCGNGRSPLAGIKSGGTERLVQAGSCAVTANQWVNVTAVADSGTLSLYLDGVRVATDEVGFVPGDVLDQSLNTIGRSPWPDVLFQGEISHFRIYERALTDTEVAELSDADAVAHSDELRDAAQSLLDSLGVSDMTAITHIALPTASGRVTWHSSQPEVVAPDGTVNPPLSGQEPIEVQLTATTSLRGQSATKTITVTVEPSNETAVEHAQRLAEQFIIAPVVASGTALPEAPAGTTVEVGAVQGAGVTVTDGTIVLDGDEQVDATITVRVTDELSGTIVQRQFAVQVIPESQAAHLLAYSRTPTTAAEANNADVAFSMHLALSDGESWTPLNENYGIFFPKTSQPVPANGSSDSIIRSLRDPHLFAMPDGGYGIVATRLARGGGSDGTQPSKMLFATTADLLSYEEVGLIDLGVTSGVNQPAVVWDSAAEHYVVTWISDDGIEMYTTFDNLEMPQTRGEAHRGGIVATAGTDTVDIPQYATGNTLVVPAETATALQVRFGRITNSTVESFDEVVVDQGANLTTADLPETAKLGYVDRSVATRAVEWNADDLAEIDTATPGEYTVTGTIKQPQYSTPFADERADPSVFRYQANGRTRFLMIATEDLNMNPIDPANGPHMPIRVADRIEDLSDEAIADGRNVEIDLLRAGDTDAAGNAMTGCFWAPEFHVINGRLSILFMPCYNGSNGKPDMWTGRASIIQLKQDQDGNDLDPAVPANWTKAQPVVRADGSALNLVQGISLDMTFFEDSGTSYYAWQMLGSVFIARVDPTNPTRLTSAPVRIIAPEYAWDNTIAEGPNVHVENGTLYMIYSGSTVGDTYTTGLVTASAGKGVDLTDPAAWTKLNYPIQKSGLFNGQWQLGTGHGMWSYDEDGNLLYVFHARTDHNGLSGRDMFVRRVHFAADGMPVLDMEADEEVAPANRTVSVTVRVTEIEQQVRFSAEISNRCVAGKVVQVVRVANEHALPVSFTVSSPFGSRDVAAVQSGRASSVAFSSRLATIASGTVSVTATAQVGGGTVQVERELDSPAATCG